MPRFNQGDTVRLKSGDGPLMTVERYETDEEVTCSYWVKGEHKRSDFSEGTLEVAHESKPTVGVFWLGKERQ